MRSLIQLTLEIKEPTIATVDFAYPRDFIFQNIPSVDLVICDYNFKHTNAKFYWEFLCRYRVVIFTGSIENIDIDCYRILDKCQFDELIELIRKIKNSA
jgi:hypothetical protein